MEERTATLEHIGTHPMNMPATEPDNVHEPRSGAMKFTYASGSRPLEGFTIKRGIGRGGFGEVYYATSDGGKEVALKLIRRNLDIELRGVSHCLNLKHQHLLTLYDIKSDEQGDSWVVMEYVGGESLEDVIARNPNGLPPEDAVRWFCGIAAGVGYLHDHGIVHRDLKPANVFSDEGGVKLGDYGLSKFISTSRRSGQTESVGTVHYMAPEVANGRYGKEIDLYALGIILYEMLTGHVPFEGESVGEVLMKHLTAQPDLSKLNEPYRSVIGQALDKDPQQRVKSVNEMLRALPGGVGTGPTFDPIFAETIVHPAVFVSQPAPPQPKTFAERLFDDEPIWRWMHDSVSQLRSAWDRSELPMPLKLGVLAVAAVAFLTTLGFWTAALVFYVMYLGVRAVWLAWFQPAPAVLVAAPAPQYARPAVPAGATPATPPVENQTTYAPLGGGPRSRHKHRREKIEYTLPGKTAREKTTELLGSLLLSAAVSAALCLFISGVYESASLERLVWLGMVGTLGSWAIMVPSKFWEGHKGEPVVRRIVLMMVGIGVGLSGYGISRMLLVDLPYAPGLSMPPSGWQSGSSFDGSPDLSNYVAYFAFLYAIGWSNLADPLRGKRFRFWDSVGCVFWAWLLSQFLTFPQPWGSLVAMTMSVSTQLSAPWFDRRQRTFRQAA